MTITEFLLARIAEDEAAMAGAEGAAAWPLDTMRPQVSGDSQSSWVVIGRDRVLAECEAKRRIVKLHHPDRDLENWYWTSRACAECGGLWHVIVPFGVPTDIGPEQGCLTLRTLAAVYADHPDFDPAWRVAD